MMKVARRTRRFAPLLGLCVIAACARQPGRSGSAGPLAAGDHTVEIEHGGRDRYFILRVPAGGETVHPRPLVLALHGGGGNPGDFKSESGLDEVADREGFLVAYPAGTGLLPRTLLTWNAGTHCCGYALDRDIDDVGFLRAVVEDVAGRTPVDRRRVYATGHSNGAIMAYRLAVEASDVFAAIAAVAGAMAVGTFEPWRPVPVLHIHSVDDPRALYGGGLGPPFPLGGERVLHTPVLDGLSLWRARNGCAPAETTLEERSGQPNTPNAGQRAVKLAWTPCATGAPVMLWRMHGVGHGWPGSRLPPVREAIAGPSTTLISAAEEAWGFFRQHSAP